jgi:hypothetical protein
MRNDDIRTAVGALVTIVAMMHPAVTADRFGGALRRIQLRDKASEHRMSSLPILQRFAKIGFCCLLLHRCICL